MGKSLANTVNTTNQTVLPSNNLTLLGNVTRKYGCGISINTNNVVLNCPGYYIIDTEVQFSGTEGDVILDIVQDGNIIGSAKVSVATASTEFHTVNIIAAPRVYCKQASTISVVVDPASTSNPTISRLQLLVVKY